MKVSLCATVKDEKASVEQLIKSILEQSRLPDEIIIVDGGSRDRTIERIQAYQVLDPHLIQLIIKLGANISRGRNIAIRQAKYDYIAIKDNLNIG